MRIMSVDFGDARTGLAICDEKEMLASPAGVIFEKRLDSTVAKAAKIVRDSGAALIVVGHPINMNGTLGPRSELCREFGQKLSMITGIPVKMWDERSSTVSAAQYLNVTNTRGKKRKNIIDAVAATIILESYLEYRKNHPGEI